MSLSYAWWKKLFFYYFEAFLIVFEHGLNKLSCVPALAWKVFGSAVAAFTGFLAELVNDTAVLAFRVRPEKLALCCLAILTFWSFAVWRKISNTFRFCYFIVVEGCVFWHCFMRFYHFFIFYLVFDLHFAILVLLIFKIAPKLYLIVLYLFFFFFSTVFVNETITKVSATYH